MVFSSLVFLCIFLPLTLTCYYAVPARWRNTVALIASLLFYAWGAPRFVFVLIVSSSLDYIASRYLTPEHSHKHILRRTLLVLTLTTNLSVFFYCKYMNFFVEQLNHVLGGHQAIPWTKVILPIGISFFTFQKLSYLMDVYRGNARPARNLQDYLLYVSLFPQLIAGPIVRYHDVALQLVSRHYNAERFLEGVWRFCFGLGRKVLIANVLGNVADDVFGLPPNQLSPAVAWMGALCYTFQIYFDFSGYSDMAIGLGKMLGLDFLENFNFPYIAASFTEFWRRWHISLSNWMREYLYIPLGGNRVSLWRTYFNLWLVFLISGFWHGASWNFVVWGGYHGAFLSIDKYCRTRNMRALPRIIAIPLTFTLVLIGWVFFRAETLPVAIDILGRMAGLTEGLPTDHTMGSIMGAQAWTALGCAALLSIAPIIRGHEILKDWPITGCSKGTHLKITLRFMLSVIILLGSLCCLIAGQFNPFIYFRF
jgi:alginate O-acetyltransferase complex protein AlgI